MLTHSFTHSLCVTIPGSTERCGELYVTREETLFIDNMEQRSWHSLSHCLVSNPSAWRPRDSISNRQYIPTSNNSLKPEKQAACSDPAVHIYTYIYIYTLSIHSHVATGQPSCTPRPAELSNGLFGCTVDVYTLHTTHAY